eukprot:8237358-Pyramimonas_sp.AAC.1
MPSRDLLLRLCLVPDPPHRRRVDEERIEVAAAFGLAPLLMGEHLGIACATIAVHLLLENAGPQAHLGADVGRQVHRVVSAGGAAKCSFAGDAT